MPQTPPPADAFADGAVARLNAMVEYLRTMMDDAAERNGQKPDFHWYKTQPSRPAFADVVFGCGNKVFAVIGSDVVEKKLPDGGMEIAVTVDAEKRDLLIRESLQNGLVPAMFPMWPDTLRPLHGDWNLLALPEGGLFDPVAAGLHGEPGPLSAWELNCLCVRAARLHLRETGRRVLSWQDMTGFYPQIWFEERDGIRAWLVVVADVSLEGDVPLPAALRELPARLAPLPGYVARVGIRSAKRPGSIPCRGEDFLLAYRGEIPV